MTILITALAAFIVGWAARSAFDRVILRIIVRVFTSSIGKQIVVRKMAEILAEEEAKL